MPRGIHLLSTELPAAELSRPYRHYLTKAPRPAPSNTTVRNSILAAELYRKIPLSTDVVIMAGLVDHALLDLEPVSVPVRDPRKLREPQHPLLGDVPDGDLRPEGEKVMFADAPHLQSRNHHHLVRRNWLEERSRVPRVVLDKLLPPQRYLGRRVLQVFGITVPSQIAMSISRARSSNIAVLTIPGASHLIPPGKPEVLLDLTR